MESPLQRLKQWSSPEAAAPWMRRLGFVAGLGAAVLLASTAAEVTWRVLAPPEAAAPAATGAPGRPPGRTAPGDGRPGEEPSGGLAEVAALHLFGRPPADALADETARREIPLEAPKTRLNITLRGVLAVGGEGRGTAIIADSGGQTVYTVGAGLPGRAVLEHVYGDRVILSRDGEFEMLLLERERVEPGRPGAVVGAAVPGRSPVRRAPPERREVAAVEREASASGNGAERQVERRELEALRDDLHRNPERLAEMVSVAPVLRGGTISGFRVTPRGDEGAGYFERAGLRPGDVVTAVNDIPVHDTDRLEALVGELETAREVRLRVERGDGEENLVLRID